MSGWPSFVFRASGNIQQGVAWQCFQTFSRLFAILGINSRNNSNILDKQHGKHNFPLENKTEKMNWRKLRG